MLTFMSFYHCEHFSLLLLYYYYYEDYIKVHCTVKMTVAQDERKLNYEGPILSIEDVPGVDSKEARVKF